MKTARSGEGTVEGAPAETGARGLHSRESAVVGVVRGSVWVMIAVDTEETEIFFGESRS